MPACDIFLWYSLCRSYLNKKFNLDSIPLTVRCCIILPMYRPAISVVHFRSSSRGGPSIQSIITNENGGILSSTQRLTSGSRNMYLVFNESRHVVKTTLILESSLSGINQIGATWGLPSLWTVDILQLEYQKSGNFFTHFIQFFSKIVNPKVA